MPSPLSLTVSAAKRVPWVKVWATALWLVKQGRDRLDNLSESEQRELRKIIASSKGLPGNLKDRDKTRVKNLVKKAVKGS